VVALSKPRTRFEWEDGGHGQSWICWGREGRKNNPSFYDVVGEKEESFRARSSEILFSEH